MEWQQYCWTGRSIDWLEQIGCRVLAFDKYPSQELAGKPQVEYVELKQLLSESNIISLHAPLTDETHHLINADTIEQMKDDVMLINTSRGGLVDTLALIEALKNNKIGSAGLDVYEEEAGGFYHDYSSSTGALLGPLPEMPPPPGR